MTASAKSVAHGIDRFDVAEMAITIFMRKQDEIVGEISQKNYFTLSRAEREFMDYAGYEYRMNTDQWKPNPEWEEGLLWGLGNREAAIVELTLKKMGRAFGDSVREFLGIQGDRPLMFSP